MNFQPIAFNVDVVPILSALASNPQLWNQETLRTTHPGTPHSQVSGDILLRFNDLALYEQSGDAASVVDQHESINYPAMFKLPSVRPVIYDLMRRVEAERLGRVIITRLPPGSSIARHTDGGDHAAYYDRFQLMLQNYPGSMFECNDESQYFPTGALFWFDNSKTHAVVNNSIADRLALIIDLRTFR